MAATRQGGAGIGLPANYPLWRAGSQLTVGAGPVAMPGGTFMLVPPGQYAITCGAYTFLQVKDPTTGQWRALAQSSNQTRYVSSDGTNYRVANLTGCAVGALITNVGSGYTSDPTVSASAGSSTWDAIVGGAINSTITITTAGAGYTHAPLLLFDPPPAGGVQATAYATVSAGAIATVVVTNQGAGYTVAPTCYVIPNPLDTITTQAVLTVNATLAGSGTITAILCTDPGIPVTAVPTLTISGGGGASGAATAVMCFAATGFSIDNAGAVYGNAQPFLVQANGGVVAGTPGAVVNPQFDKGILTPRTAFITGTSTAGGAIQTTGSVIQDAGLFQAVPQGFVLPAGTGALPTTTAIVTITVGARIDTVVIQPV